MKFNFYISFQHLGQDAASKAHRCANTNVGVIYICAKRLFNQGLAKIQNAKEIMWFTRLTGLEDDSHQTVHDNIHVEGDELVIANGKQRLRCGTLEIANLESFRARISLNSGAEGELSVKETIGNVQILHQDPENENALFQAASQFNLLEMVSPHVAPEHGINCYSNDHTQGPACAIACGAGTIYRNYFVEVNGKIGQTRDNQIDCLDEIGQALGNPELHLWTMQNGYALVNKEGLLNINNQLDELNFEERERLKGLLKIGVQWNTEVTLSSTRHLVSQAYCSALPVAYTHVDSMYWENFARLVLEATYEATLYVALKNFQSTGCPKVYLTLVGGGAFGNGLFWILDSLTMALRKFKKTPLDVKVVSYGGSNKLLVKALSSIST